MYSRGVQILTLRRKQRVPHSIRARIEQDPPQVDTQLALLMSPVSAEPRQINNESSAKISEISGQHSIAYLIPHVLILLSIWSNNCSHTGQDWPKYLQIRKRNLSI